MAEVKAILDPSVVDKIVVVIPQFSTWTGVRAMHEGDFTVGIDGKLPPKSVAKSLGCKAIIDTDELRIFTKLKVRAETVLDTIGVKFLSGWAIPEEKAAEAYEKLDQILTQHAEAKTDFLNRYDALVSSWAERNPEFSSEILQGKLDVAALNNRITATYESFKMIPAEPSKAQALTASVSGLSNELIASVIQSARTLYKESIAGRDRASKKTISAVRKIRNRLAGLAFLSSSILPLVTFIHDTLAKLPLEGYFTGAQFWCLAALIKTLGDETLIGNVMSGQVSDTVVSEIPDSVSTDSSGTEEITKFAQSEKTSDLFAEATKATAAAEKLLKTPHEEEPTQPVIEASVVYPSMPKIADVGFYF